MAEGEGNKDIVISFLKMAASGKVREAYLKFVGAAFRHHNPFFEGSAEALMAGMEENALQNPNKVLEVKRDCRRPTCGCPFSRTTQA